MKSSFHPFDKYCHFIWATWVLISFSFVSGSSISTFSCFPYWCGGGDHSWESFVGDGIAYQPSNSHNPSNSIHFMSVTNRFFSALNIHNEPRSRSGKVPCSHHHSLVIKEGPKWDGIIALSFNPFIRLSFIDSIDSKICRPPYRAASIAPPLTMAMAMPLLRHGLFGRQIVLSSTTWLWVPLR